MLDIGVCIQCFRASPFGIDVGSRHQSGSDVDLQGISLLSVPNCYLVLWPFENRAPKLFRGNSSVCLYKYLRLSYELDPARHDTACVNHS